MTRSPLSARRPTDAHLASLLAEQVDLPLSYGTEGMTRSDLPPSGYRRERVEVEIGSGTRVFEEAAGYLQTWQVHRQAGLRVAAVSPVQTGTCLVMALRLALVHLTLTCRVVYTSESDNRRGFAYGTLRHHVESGEELFFVSRDADDRVRFTVMAYSRPGHLVTAVGAPVARRMQHGPH